MSLLTRAELHKFQNCIEEEDYKSALLLAEKYGLDKDDVYKPQWSSSDYGEEAVRGVLSNIEDHMWVVKECKERISPSYEAMNALLNCGLRVTEPYVSPEGGKSFRNEGGESDKSWWFRCKRLRLLQYKDRLETFIGISNGRYSQKEYRIFRSAPLKTVGIRLAERGKTGALALLFSRHTYSLAPHILELLDAIPETVPPSTYSQLLPDVSPPKPFPPRKNEDLVENLDILKALKSGKRSFEENEMELSLEESTEHVVKLSKGLKWPAKTEVISWYLRRAREIDQASGLLENTLSLLELGVAKGLNELESLSKEVSDLMAIMFTGDSEDVVLSFTLSDWERLSKYEKFKLILDGAGEDNVVERLREQAVPFMPKERGSTSLPALKSDSPTPSFLVTWLREAAEDNKFSLCAAVLVDCSKEPKEHGFFQGDEELAQVALDGIYSCAQTEEDAWRRMSWVLQSLPSHRDNKIKEPGLAFEDANGQRGLRKGLMRAFRGAVGKSADFPLGMSPLVPPSSDDAQPMSPRVSPDVLNSYLGRSGVLSDELEERVRCAEGHVKAGQLLLKYQVPKPIRYFLACQGDVTGTKQLIRLLLAKFPNKDLARSDSGWASLWQDLRTLQEKAFPFLDKETLLLEFCQGLLRAGKFNLAKNYLKGTGTIGLHIDKAEKLVLRIAREYFYSAPSLDSSSIEKAIECLNLLPPSQTLRAELNIVEAVTERLPALGVTLLPLEFRQLKDKMEAVKMAISSEPEAYSNVPEIMDLASLLGLTSADEQAAVEAAIARQAAGAGDFGLARDLCLELVRKGHGEIWDLCAALGRGPDFDLLDLGTRKELLSFALAHCDVESVAELLSAWKEFDLMNSCNDLGRVLDRPAMAVADYENVGMSVSGYLRSDSVSEGANVNSFWQETKLALSQVARAESKSGREWESRFMENRKALGFMGVNLPWLVKVRSDISQNDSENDDGWMEVEEEIDDWHIGIPKEFRNESAQAAALVLRLLAEYDILADDSLVLQLAREAVSSPVCKEDDRVGCGYLLNLGDSRHGTEILEEELKRRENYQESQLALDLVVSFSSLQASASVFHTPLERRTELRKFLSEDGRSESETTSPASSNFWTEFRSKAVQTLKFAEESRKLQQMIPGVDAARFIAGDQEYITESIFNFVDSVKARKEEWLPGLLALSHRYHVDTWRVLVRYFLALLAVEETPERQVLAEISGYYSKLLVNSEKVNPTVQIYEQIVTSILKNLRNERRSSIEYVEKRKLVRALVSLGDSSSVDTEKEIPPVEEDTALAERLNTVRCAVWMKLCEFAEDLDTPLPTRIFVLELLEAIKLGKVPRKGDFWRSFQLDDGEAVIISWGHWEAEVGNAARGLTKEEARGPEERSQPVNALLALRSTHIISSLWPSEKVTSAELSTPEAASSFFSRLLETTSSSEHAVALRALLMEWEVAFGFDHTTGGEKKKESSSPTSDAGENWGEGWEDFGESNWLVHTLHSCWKSTLLKLVERGRLAEALETLDSALLHPTKVLLSQEDADDLVAVVGSSSPTAALQLSLLLPYNSAQEHALQSLEQVLSKGEGLTIKQDVIALVLSSGLLPTIANDETLPRVYSALCRSLGHLALQVQELQVSVKKLSMADCIVSSDNVPLSVVAFPFFIGELVKARQYAQAGALVLQFMRVHPALTTWNAAYGALQRYLNTEAHGASVEAILKRGKLGESRIQRGCVVLSYLKNTTDSLVCRLEETLRSALKTLVKDMS
ncbi:hypothetical protein R1sor_027413 [Riccia sorocarpa]|uniref:Sec39 domain-containing protein n=1 Tax=Riccia sorocarpa TaxID=122646 RepID=A0ABD3GHA3_9MARC